MIRVILFIAAIIGLHAAGWWAYTNFPTASLLVIAAAFLAAWVAALAWVWKR